jgi:hypothetical protein
MMPLVAEMIVNYFSFGIKGNFMEGVIGMKNKYCDKGLK